MRIAIVASALFLGSAAPALAAGDVALGQTLYESRCGACHSIQSNRVGPKHLGVVGRKAGSIPDYDYSPALKKAKFIWTPKQIDKWLQGPGKLVRGTNMAFTVPKPEDRAAIIAYLSVAK
jgi:cytochrome c